MEIRFIELTHTRSRRKIHVEVSHISELRETAETTLLMTGAKGVYVDETPEQIKALIKNA